MAILKELIRDLHGIIVPQYLKDDESTFEAVKGSNGALNVNASITGSLPNQTLEEELTQADAVGGVLTFSANIGAIGITNTDATNAGVFAVNGISITVPSDKYVEYVVGGTPSPTVTVTGATSYIVDRLV